MAGAAPKSFLNWRIWWLASRPKTLTAAVAPVLVGTAVAIVEDGFVPLVALAALLIGLLIQIATNLYNDYADFQRGTDTVDRLGPLRVTQAGWLAPGVVRRGAIVTFTFAGLIGSTLILRGGWTVAAIGLAAIVAGLAYTAGPWPLAYNGLGDLFVWIFFGFVAVGGTTYVQLGRIPYLAWMGGLAMGALITALLAVNNIRDRDTDRVAGRRTIPVVFGRTGGMLEYTFCISVAYLTPLFILLGSPFQIGYLLPLITIPEAIRVLRFVRRTEGVELNQGLAETARLVFWYGILMALGFALT